MQLKLKKYEVDELRDLKLIETDILLTYFYKRAETSTI